MVSGLHSAARAAWDHTQTMSQGSGAVLPLPCKQRATPGGRSGPAGHVQADLRAPRASRTLSLGTPSNLFSKHSSHSQNTPPRPRPTGPHLPGSSWATDPCSISQGRLGQALGALGWEQCTGGHQFRDAGWWEGGIGRGPGALLPGLRPWGGSHLQGSQRAPGGQLH